MQNGTIKATKMTVTPGLAAYWRKTHDDLEAARGQPLNRVVGRALVAGFAEDMRNGLWVFNGETIVRSPAGRILDGNHRIDAVILSGVSIDVLVIEGMSEDVFNTYDSGKSRRPADYLRTLGVANENNVANAARFIIGFTENRLGGLNLVRRSEVHAFVAANPDLIESVRMAVRVRALASVGIFGALHFLFAQVDRPAADKFLADVADGANLSADDPVLMLRNRLIKDKDARRGRWAPRDVLVAGVRTWNLRRSGGTTARLVGVVKKGKNMPDSPEIAA